MSLLKRKSSPREIAESLFIWTFHSEDLPETVRGLHEVFQTYLSLDYATVYREYIHFRMFVTDWVLDSAQQRDERMQKVRAAFNLLITLMTREQPHPEEMTKEIDAHFNAYAAAANTDHHLGVAWAAATAFCRLCGIRGAAIPASIVTDMSIEFSTLMNTVEGTLSKTQIA